MPATEGSVGYGLLSAHYGELLLDQRVYINTSKGAMSTVSAKHSMDIKDGFIVSTW